MNNKIFLASVSRRADDYYYYFVYSVSRVNQMICGMTMFVKFYCFTAMVTLLAHQVQGGINRSRAKIFFFAYIPHIHLTYTATRFSLFDDNNNNATIENSKQILFFLEYFFSLFLCGIWNWNNNKRGYGARVSCISPANVSNEHVDSLPEIFKRTETECLTLFICEGRAPIDNQYK